MKSLDEQLDPSGYDFVFEAIHKAHLLKPEFISIHPETMLDYKRYMRSIWSCNFMDKVVCETPNKSKVVGYHGTPVFQDTVCNVGVAYVPADSGLQATKDFTQFGYEDVKFLKST